MHQFLENNADYAACQPKVKSYKEPTKFEHAGAVGGFLDRWGYPFCRGRIFMIAEEDEGQYDQPMEVFWATGACLLIRAELYQKFEGFDERFFAHMEEIDLCWRMKNQGHKIGVVPQSVVYHVGGGTLEYTNPKKTFLNFRNSLFMIFKNDKGHYLPLLIFWRLILDGIAGAKFLIEGNKAYTYSVLKAHFHFYGALPYLIKQRRKWKRGPVYTRGGLYKRSIVLDFFLFKKVKYKDLKMERMR